MNIARIIDVMMLVMRFMPLPMRRWIILVGQRWRRRLRRHFLQQKVVVPSVPDAGTTLQHSGGEFVVLRHLAVGDEETLLSFYQGLSEESEAFYRPYPFLDLEQMLEIIDANKRGVQRDWVLVNTTGEIVGHGFLLHSFKPMPALGICVSDTYQGGGLGRKMMDFIIRQSKVAFGNEGIRLVIKQRNQRALNLYRSLGFQIIRSRRVMRGGTYRPGSYVDIYELELHFEET